MSTADNTTPTSSEFNTSPAPILFMENSSWIIRLWRRRGRRREAERRDLSTPQNGRPVFVAVEGKTLAKDIWLYNRKAQKFEWRRCTVDSAAPLNLVRASEKELEELGYSMRPYTGREIKNLGFSVLPIGTVSIRFKFWGEDEDLEEDFHVLPRRWFLVFKIGPAFDLLLGWEWMTAHPHLLVKWMGKRHE